MKVVKAKKIIGDQTIEKLIYIPDTLEDKDLVEDIVVSWAERIHNGISRSWKLDWEEVTDKDKIKKCLKAEIDEAQANIDRSEKMISILNEHLEAYE